MLNVLLEIILLLVIKYVIVNLIVITQYFSHPILPPIAHRQCGLILFRDFGCI